MPQKFNTITEEQMNAMSAQLKHFHINGEEWENLFAQFCMYQENRLKINKDSRESKMAARKEGGGGEGRSKSAKMTGVVRLVAIEGQENTFKVEKVSVPAPAPKPQSEEEEDNAPLVNKVVAKKIALKVKKPTWNSEDLKANEVNLAENPEALAEHLASIQRKPSAAVEEARAQAEAWKKSEAERKKAEGIAKRKATLAAKKQELANAAKAALVANLKESESEDSGEETETDVETEDEE